MPANLGRVAGNFEPQSQTSDEILLLDGDRLFIPEKTKCHKCDWRSLKPN